MIFKVVIFKIQTSKNEHVRLHFTGDDGNNRGGSGDSTEWSEKAGGIFDERFEGAVHRGAQKAQPYKGGLGKKLI